MFRVEIKVIVIVSKIKVGVSVFDTESTGVTKISLSLRTG